MKGVCEVLLLVQECPILQDPQFKEEFGLLYSDKPLAFLKKNLDPTITLVKQVIGMVKVGDTMGDERFMKLNKMLIIKGKNGKLHNSLITRKDSQEVDPDLQPPQKG